MGSTWLPHAKSREQKTIMHVPLDCLSPGIYSLGALKTNIFDGSTKSMARGWVREDEVGSMGAVRKARGTKLLLE